MSGYYEKVKSPWGIFTLLLSKEMKLKKIVFPHKTVSSKGMKKASSKVGKKLNEYLKSGKSSFSNSDIDYSSYTEFERNIIKTLMKVPSGRVISYGFLAQKAGYVGAARGAGSVMRKNPIPLVIPCHRVVKSDGSLGQYSQGNHWKKRLLSLEGAL